MSNSTMVQERLRTMRIVVGALMIGVLTFVGMMLATGNAPDHFLRDNDIVTFVSMFWLVMCAAAACIVIVFHFHKAAGKDERNVLGIFFTRTIIAAAFFEGAAFPGIIACQINHSSMALVVAFLGTIGVAAQFPSSNRMQRWLAQAVPDERLK